MTASPIADAQDPNAEVGAGLSTWPLRQAAWALVAATIVAAVLNAQALYDWADFLPLGPGRDLIFPAAEWWLGATQSIGADQLHAAIRDAFARFQFWEG